MEATQFETFTPRNVLHFRE